MEMTQYRSLVEDSFGPVYIPEDTAEIDDIIDCLYESMESVSGGDFRIFQAIEIIERWRDENGLLRKSNPKNN